MKRPASSAAAVAKPFDAATKQLVEMRPADWVAFLRLPLGDAVLMETDLATITTEADRVIRVEASPTPYLLHLEFQASYKEDLPERLLRYNVLLRYRHKLPVQSAVLLLRREADGPAMTGELRYGRPGALVSDKPALWFHYDVIRVHQEPVEALLSGGVTTLPFALLAAAPETELPAIVRRMQTRIAAEVNPADAAILWTTTFLLLGLRYTLDFAERLLQGVRGMEESSTYQALLARGEAKGKAEGEARGRAEEARAIILRLGRKRLGEPSAEAQSALNSITAPQALEELAERLLEVENWDELFTAV